MVIVASTLWVWGRFYSVSILIDDSPHVNVKLVRFLMICVILLNINGNIAKFLARYWLSYAFQLYVFLQILVIICEIVILIIFVAVVRKAVAISFLIDIPFISLTIAVIEFTAFGIHRILEVRDREPSKKD
ncbi:hypothetical protein KIN20_018278 [Parelaphostrongylus tenuis]|nr:hypothetical protein KIN20_018278 [Parelaphostrongylus tenuis]